MATRTRTPTPLRSGRGEWAFPNAIAESVRRTAALKGQHANRLEMRDVEWPLPLFLRVDSRERCVGASNLRRHEPTEVVQGERKFTDPFCRTCGRLVASG